MKPRNFILIALLQAGCLSSAYSGPKAPSITMGQLTVLYSFDGTKGKAPVGGVIQGSDGNLYGTTEAGGSGNFGALFKITTNGAFTGLNSFKKTNGSSPECALAQGSDLNYYGTTLKGGTNNHGVVFKMTPAGGLTTFVTFTGDNGSAPYAGLVLGSDGFFYGTTSSGGQNGKGTVFQLSQAGALTTIWSFSGSEGTNPHAGLIEGSDGSFYGTTTGGGLNGKGTVFKITSNGILTTLWSFNPKTDGANPSAGLIQGSDGLFYGTTPSGGQNGKGTVFKISSFGAFSVLWAFGGDDGSNPHGGLVEGYDGSFYGTTTGGGANGKGTLFKITSGGSLFTLCSLNSKLDGSSPNAGLILCSDGNFYGTAEKGGSKNMGTIFQFALTSSVTAEAATLLATVNPQGSNTTVYFDFGTTTSYGGHTAVQPLGDGKSDIDINASLTGLLPQTTYHYRLVVVSDAGTFYGPDQTFTTGAIGFELVLSKFDPADGILNAIFSNSGTPAMNNNLGLAFQATVTGTGSSTGDYTTGNNSGIWADDNSGTRQLVVQIGTEAPGIPGALFSVLSDPVYNNNNAVAFLGTLKIGTGDTVSTPVNNSIGIWSNDGGTLHLVVRQAQSAPGCPNGEVFSSFSQFVLPDQGGVVLLGNLTSGFATTANNQGIWAVDKFGVLKLIVRKGDTLDGKTIQTLTFLSSVNQELGQTRSFAQSNGNLLYKVTFTDSSWGIYKVVFP